DRYAAEPGRRDRGRADWPADGPGRVSRDGRTGPRRPSRTPPGESRRERGRRPTLGRRTSAPTRREQMSRSVTLERMPERGGMAVRNDTPDNDRGTTRKPRTSETVNVRRNGSSHERNFDQSRAN